MKAGAAGRIVPCVLGWECARGPFAAIFGQKEIAFGNFGFPNAISFYYCPLNINSPSPTR